ADELGEGQIAVQAVNDPVAVAVGVRAGVVALVTLRVGKASKVQPVPGVTLAVVRRRQQSIDETLVGGGGMVVREGVHLFRRRRQTEQVEVKAADERASGRLFDRDKPVLLPGGREESVDGSAEVPGGYARHRRAADGPKRPVFRRPQW